MENRAACLPRTVWDASGVYYEEVAEDLCSVGE